ncbi:MAG TPA: glycine betaine/L-proline ABC transporter ATP-binding protein [Glutamicibacter sp.]|uniref:Osmoprotectant (Glycine betaine/carnitine/choline/L-proline) ABC transporter, ATP-binding subunit n=1 Tax=Glutamicibacter arilaitensis (strain DSM 16368 / CIP 108037 / IAM 15318 / JCM 13566 / NCIMB 14258 / Re117) TaxID=861360 RepID=A0ABM9PWR2_GLUAR|nr:MULTISPECIES: glycine betaine/L-proline ABC transporter ATP-binding protein [Glutamicibacter]CBT75742.1 osmoprotectant (glycine betaine/carnitine/choline/L-proline) ABC transporter, ATP-binding subunit [Glutamicibacter arilaitensis Re117]HCH48331.1 glycine betaine/L-proline ABC transporter ATP-binding protein [Glutamicibacter sp.]HCJ54264.1 glycine betaine/L-proline ABC transporter ATP-binding protein [Glutamicibacter sp.]HCM93992.1 glycine betaine/L-proline ABC transporter ATP-binding prote
MTTNIALKVEGLYKVFGRKPKDAVKQLESGTPREKLPSGNTAAVIDASFEVKTGEIFVVMGLSGSGKSTLIRTLNGLWEASAGTVSLGEDIITGMQPAKLRAVRRKRVSMVFQHFALLPHRSVLENVAYPLEQQGVGRAERLATAAKTLKLVGLDGWGEKMPSELSGGMQQRVGIARALSADTEILLMDEAFSALDPLIRREMQEQLVELQATLGKTIVFITHDLNEAMFLGDRIAVMRDGRIVQIGTPEEILTDPANDYVEQFVQDVDRARVLTAASVMVPGRSVIQENAGPRAALRQMRDAVASAAIVTGRDRKVLGMITDRDALKLVRRGESSLSSKISALSTVDADTALIDLFVPSVESPLPVTVTDAENRLLGVIPRVTLLAALASTTPQTEEISVLDSPLPSDIVDAVLQIEPEKN